MFEHYPYDPDENEERVLSIGALLFWLAVGLLLWSALAFTLEYFFGS